MGTGPTIEDCLVCSDKQIYQYCVSHCTRSMPDHLISSKICYPALDTSTLLLPDAIYVTSAGTGGNLGTITDPFFRLSVALSQNFMAYTTIYLLDGIHEIQSLTKAEPEGVFLKSPYQPLLNSFSNKELLVTTLICSDKPQCTNTRATILIGDTQTRFDIAYPITFRNVIIDGKKTLVVGCIAAECFYCPVVQANEMGIIISDKGKVLTAGSYAPQSECDKNSAVSLISVSSNIPFVLEDVDFINIRYQPKAIIYNNGGFLTLTRVNFNNIVVKASGAVILQEECNTPSYGCGSLTFNQGSVMYLNNGYEFTDTLKVSGFLHADGLGDIGFTSVLFSMNIAIDWEDQYHGLLTLVRFRSVTLQSCSFTYNIATNLLSLQAEGLIFAQTTDGQNNAIDYAIEHVIINIVTIANNLVSVSLMKAQYAIDLQNLKFTNCIVSDNVSQQSALFSIVYKSTLSTQITEGEFKTIEKDDGSTVLAYFASRHAIIAESRFSGNLGMKLFEFHSVANIQMNGNCVFSANGDSKTTTYNELILQYFVADSNAYISTLRATTRISVCSSLLYLSMCSSVSLANLDFSSNSCESGVAGVEGSQIVRSFLIQSVQFTNNISTADDGTVLSIHDTSVSAQLQSVTVSNNRNSAGAGAVYFGPAVSVTLISCAFVNNQALSGGGIWARDPLKLSISATTFDSNISTKGNGGAIYLMVENGTDLYSLEITDSFLTKNQSMQGAGLCIFSEKPTRPYRIQIASVSFSENRATTLGGAVYIDANIALSINCKITACTFTGNTSTRGTIQLLFASGKLEIAMSTFTLNQAQTGAGVESSTKISALVIISDSIFTFNTSPGGIVALTEVDHVKKLQTFQCTFAKNTGINITLQRGSWMDSNSSYSDTEGSAVVMSENSAAAVNGSSFKRNKASGSGGAVRLFSASTFQCTMCTFMGNAAGDKGGAMFLEQKSSIDITGSSFTENTSVDRGSAIFILGFSAVTSSITSTSFTFNSGNNAGVISLVLSALAIVNATFDSNVSKGISPGIILNLSTLSVKNSRFMRQTGKVGVFLYSISESVATISNSSFIEATAEFGGAFSVIESNLYVTSSNLTNIRAVSGAGFIAYSQSKVVLAQVRMEHFTASDSAIGLMSEGNLTVEKCFFGYFSSGGINAERLTQVLVTESTFQNGNGASGGALACTRCQNVQILKSVFISNFANTGGALYLTTYAETPVVNSYQVKNCVFANNVGWKAGAVYTNNVGVEFDYCNFVNNTARKSLMWSQQRTGNLGSGGAIATDCTDVDTCSVSITNSYFAYNDAETAGGAIAWSDVRPYIFNTTFLRNSAEYGNDISSFAVALKEFTVGRRLSPLSEIPSGQNSQRTIELRLVDHYGQIVTTDNSSAAELISVNSSSTTLSGLTKVTAVKGIFTFDSFIITAEPLTSVQIQVQSFDIDISKSIKAKDATSYISSISFTAEMRDCVLGESHVDKICQICDAGKYSLDPSSPLCLNCPDEAICYGNYTMVPKAGYWRARFDTEVFYSCFYAASCVGSPEPPAELSFTGDCAAGYQGRLCQSCVNGYSKSSKYKCELCPNQSVNAVRLLFIAVAVGIFVGIMVFTTMRSAHQEKSQASIVIKIFMNYLQIVVLVAAFNLDWPKQVLDLFNVHETAGSFTEQAISLDCFLTSGESTAIEDLVYGKLTVMAILPIFLADVAVFVWILIYWNRRQLAFPKDGLIATIVILLFLVHPTITKYMFDMFSCMEIDGQYYLVQALDVSCWNTKHFFYIGTCALPSIILWVIGVPALCLLFLIKNRRSLGSLSERIRLGFIFNGYRTSAYYWEFVILYRKILIISCSVFLATISIPMQALIVMLVLLAALYIQDTVQPYTTESLNRMELKSNISATVTVYCGLFFLTGDLGEEAKTVLFVCIVVVNALFFTHWLKTLLGFYVIIIANSIPFVRRKLGHIHKVQDDLEDDLFVRSHTHGALGHSSCSGFTPMLKEEGRELRTMKDVYLMKLKTITEEVQKSSKLANSTDRLFDEMDEEAKVDLRSTDRA